MPKFRCEFFGNFTYAEELSYSALIEKEAELKEELSRLFAQAKYQHLHFASAGDYLLVQGLAADYEREMFHEICDAVSQLLNEGVRARLLFVDRFLDSMYLYTVNDESWQEARVAFPAFSAIGERGCEARD
jgi:hypothetical protein